MSLVTESYPDPMGKGNSLLYTEVEGESPLSPFPAPQVKLTVLTMGKDEGRLQSAPFPPSKDVFCKQQFCSPSICYNHIVWPDSEEAGKCGLNARRPLDHS